MKLADFCPGETEERFEFATRLNKTNPSPEEYKLAMLSYNCGFAAYSRIITNALDKGVIEIIAYDSEGNPFKVNKAK